MIDSVAINVVISLVFIYLLYSLLVTTINEGIASIFKLRAKTLKKGIQRMLTDDGGEINPILEQFYNQPGIKFLGEDNTKKPAYLSSASFSKALVHLCKDLADSKTTPEEQLLAGIQEIKKINPESGKYLETLFNDTEGKIDKFQESAEQWFNETMDRTSGWYKKQTQKITLIVAFVIACSFNVDTIGIVQNLSTNPELATKMGDMTDKYTKANKDSKVEIPQDTINYYFRTAQKQIDTDIKNTNSLLGLGWNFEEKNWEYKIFQHLVGIMLTAIAISFGAPFWFDLLSKLMQLRGSKKPEETPQSKTT
jgi:hypothetical protein